MDPSGAKRKLAAILAADVAGYSRLMGSDEEATYRRLGEYREIINERVAHHGGRVFGTAGESVVADFAVLVVTPVVLLLLAITIVGLPITIVGGALYVAALFPGYLLAAIAIGQWAAQRRWGVLAARGRSCRRDAHPDDRWTDPCHWRPGNIGRPDDRPGHGRQYRLVGPAKSRVGRYLMSATY